MGRRRSNQPLADAGFCLFQLLLCLLAVPSRDHARSRAAALRAAGGLLRGRRGLHARRRLSRQLPRPSRSSPRIRALLGEGCRGLRPLCPRRDAAMPLHPAAADAHGAGPDQPAPARHFRADLSGKKIRADERCRDGADAALLDDVDRRLPRRVFRDRRHQGEFCAVRHHRHRARADVARHRLCAAASLHGRGRRLGRRLGLCARRHGRGDQGACRFLPRLRRHDPHRRRGRPGARQARQGDGRRACGRRGDPRQARRLQRRRQAHLPEARRGEGTARHLPRRVRNFKIRGSSGKVNIALDSMPEFPALPKDSPCLSRRHAFHRFDRAHGARL